MTEIDTMIADATDAKTFDVLAFTQGRSLVTEKFDVYLDENAMHRLNAAIQASGMDTSADDFQPTEEMLEAMTDLKESKVTLHLRALDPLAENSLREKHGVGEEDTTAESKGAFFNEKFALMVVKAVRPDGAVDNTAWTAERADEFINRLPIAQANALVATIQKMDLASVISSNLVTPDFLSRV